MVKHSKKSQKTTTHDVILDLNDHWIVLIKPVIAIIFSWAMFFFLAFVADLIKDVSLNVSIFLDIANFCMILCFHHWFFLKILHWELSNWIVTTKRVIDFQNTPFIKNDVTFINIDEIHEIEKKKHGFLANIFDYGEIFINLAATPTPIVLDFIPHPGKFANLIESIRSKNVGDEIDIEAFQKIYGRKYRSVIRQDDEISLSRFRR